MSVTTKRERLKHLYRCKGICDFAKEGQLLHSAFRNLVCNRRYLQKRRDYREARESGARYQGRSDPSRLPPPGRRRHSLCCFARSHGNGGGCGADRAVLGRAVPPGSLPLPPPRIRRAGSRRVAERQDGPSLGLGSCARCSPLGRCAVPARCCRAPARFSRRAPCAGAAGVGAGLRADACCRHAGFASRRVQTCGCDGRWYRGVVEPLLYVVVGKKKYFLQPTRTFLI